MNSKGNNSGYRRGVLLGLTMAEIFILIIFLLLLASATLLKEKEKEYADLNALNARDRTIFQRIVTVISTQSPEMTEEVVKAVESLPAIIEVIKKNELDKDNSETVAETINHAVENMAVEKKLIEERGQVSPQQQLAEAVKKMESLETEVGDLRGQKEDLMTQIKNAGRSPDLPPCWSEYIFKIDLLSEGIVVHDNPLPQRVEEKARLPIQSISFDKLTSASTFLSETGDLHQWSVQNKCRFRVLFSDKTADNEKIRYKELVGILGRRFYPREDKAHKKMDKKSSQEEDKSFFGGIFAKPKKSSKDLYN